MLFDLPLTFRLILRFKKLGGLLFLLVISSLNNQIWAQEDQYFDELGVVLNVPKLGSGNLPIAIKGDEAFVGILDLFNFLEIKIEKSDSGFVGYLLNPSYAFIIDPVKSEIIFKDVTYPVTKRDFIVTPTTTYLNSDYFGDIFGLTLNFNFRHLVINLKTDLELPKIKQLRHQKMRDNLININGEVKADTILNRTYPFFRAGMVDWGILSSQTSQGIDDNRATLGIGTMIAGGETNILLNYSTQAPFISRNQFYQWKLTNNESKLFKQITAGKIFTGATASLQAPVLGLQFSNAPVINRRSFGTYTLSDTTDPLWTVELYVNNTLIDFTEADASGFYSFEVPLMYGSTLIDLRFYGPFGEERREIRSINIPFNFIPKNEFEYSLSAGIVENEDNDKFGRFNLNYGLNNFITLGAGVEYLSGVESGEIMPFINSSIKISPSLLFTGEYIYGLKTDGLLSYKSPSNFNLELEYSNYNKDQTALNSNYLEERKVTISLPLRNRFFSAYSRFSLNQIILPTSEFTSAQILLSGVLFGIGTNFTTFGLFNDRNIDPVIYSTLSQTYKLPWKTTFLPQIQYNYSDQEFINISLRLERSIFKKGFLNLAFENNFQRKAASFEIGFRYLFDFTATSFNGRYGNQNTSISESARGSFQIDDVSNYITKTNSNSVGRAALTIIPFLDINNNGKQDKEEPGVSGLKFKNSIGNVQYNKDKTILRMMGLAPYQKIVLQAEPGSIDNIAWQFDNPIMEIETMPNQFRTIYIPIRVVGEVAGAVYFKNANGTTKGLGRILINILDEQGKSSKQVLTEGDGYFTYLGLKAGKYTAVIDPAQLENIGYTSTPGEIEFSIEKSEFGDIVDDLEFIVLEKKTN